MFNTRKQNLLYLLLLLLLMASFFTLLFTGRMNAASGEVYEITADALRDNAKDFDIEQNGFASTSDDPWIDIEVPRGKYSELILDVTALNVPSTPFTVYYCLTDTGGYSEERSVTVSLTPGEVAVALPEEQINRLRLDLTDQAGVSVGLGSVRILNADRVFSAKKAALIVAALLLALVLLAPVSALLAKLSVPSCGRLRRMVFERPKVLLVIIMAVSILVCFGSYLFGARYFAFMDIGSDTVFDYQTKWFSLADDFSAGRVAQWTLNNGVGASVSNQVTWLLDPFFWPTILAYLALGFRAAQITVAWMHCLKLILCALLCYDFLSEFSLDNVAKLTASYLYGFCGFLMLWGQHYMFSTYFLISTLVLVCMERSVKRDSLGRQHLFLTLSVAWLAAKTYYFSYMSLLAMAVYVVFRLFIVYPVREVKRWVLAGARVLGCVLLGFMLASVSLLPQIYEILTVSDRISNDSGLFRYIGLVSPDHLRTILGRLLSNNIFGIQQYHGFKNYYESEQLFFSSFLPLFFVLYVALGFREGRKTFALRLAGVFALCVLPLIPLTGHVMNAFVATSERYTYLLMPICAYIAAKVMDGVVKGRVTVLQLALATIPYPAILLYIYGTEGFVKPLGIFVLACVLCVVALIGASRVFPRGAKFVLTLLIAVIMVNVQVDSWLTTNHRITLEGVYGDDTLTEMTGTVKQINESLIESDPELFRIEKTYSDYSWFNDAMIEDYYGISAYNSTVNSSLRRFYRNCWDEVVWGADGIYIQFEQDYANARMAGLLGTKYIISNRKLEDVPQYSLREKTNGKYVYENSEYRGFGRFYTGVMTDEEYLSYGQEERDVLLQQYLLLDHHEAPTEAEGRVSIERPSTDDRIEVNVSANGPGYVFLPIPYEEGWTAKADGVTQTILQADYGFMALPVSAGDTHLVLEFRLPMLRQGALLSALGLAVVAAFLALHGKVAALRRSQRPSA